MKIAIIPARGGSKRIPKKNVKYFAGVPMIAWSIQAARESLCFDRIIVSTDDEEIHQIAIHYGAEVPFTRPSELADDYSTAFAVSQHAVGWCLENCINIEYVCTIYATAPFLNPQYLTESLSQFEKSDKQYCLAVTPYPFPVQRGIRINKIGGIEALQPEYFFSRSQDLEVFYHDAAQFYWARPNALIDGIIPYSSASMPFIIPRHFVQDIDSLEDWHRAELMYDVLVNSGELKKLCPKEY